MQEAQAKRFAAVGINFRCDGGNHRHFKAQRVNQLVEAGDMEWVGAHRKIAKFVKHRTWQKKISGKFGPTMQLVRGAPTAHKAQKMPNPSRAMGSNVALWNDGRLPLKQK